MKTTILTNVMLIAALFAGSVAQAHDGDDDHGQGPAVPQQKMYLVPGAGQGHQHHHPAPVLGIMGHMHFGEGMHIDSVMRGTAASRLGLEPGDVILRVNGVRILSERDYFTALRNSGGTVRLLVEDHRSGQRMLTRSTSLFNGAGPVKLYSKGGVQ